MLRWVIWTAFGDPVDPRRQLHQRQVVLADLDGVDRLRRQQVGDGEDLDALLLEHGNGHQEGLGDDDGLGLDHVDDRHGVLGPHGQVGARGGLVQHGQAGAAHPQALRGRGDLHRAPASTPTASPWPTPAAASPPAIRRRARSCTSPQVCRTGSCGSPVTMPVVAVAGIAEHLLGKPAHESLLGSGSCPKARNSYSAC